MIRKLFYAIVVALHIILIYINVTEASNDENNTETKFNEFLDKKFEEYLGRNPEDAALLGIKSNYGRWNDRNDNHLKREQAIRKSILEQLATNFDLDALNEQTKLTVRILKEDIMRIEEDIKWHRHNYLVTQLQGVHQELPDFLINVHRIDDLNDAEAYVSRLKKIDKVFEQTLRNLKTREALGIVPPHFTFHYVTEDLTNFIHSFEKRDESNILLSDLERKLVKLSDVDDAKKTDLLNRAFRIIRTKVKNAYRKLLEYWGSLEPKAKEKGNRGIWSLPNGTEFYAYQLRYQTTTNLTSESIHAIGVKDVKSIFSEMRAIIKKVNYTSNSARNFKRFLRTDKRFVYPENDSGRVEILKDASKFITDIIPKLKEVFATLPNAPLDVKAVESFRENSSALAFYEPPSEDGSRSGRVYFRISNVSDLPKHTLETIAYHEGMPGHHLQMSIAQELKAIPKFRRYRYQDFNAYNEGWALYSERLSKEIGLYQDPYSDFGRLGMEVFRSARLVVDTGIHWKRWTVEQAIEYLSNHTVTFPVDIKGEIERYFLLPGQATSYKIGMIKILELRNRAKRVLGKKFDIRQFHDVLLTNGAVTLTTLQELVDNWIRKILK